MYKEEDNSMIVSPKLMRGIDISETSHIDRVKSKILQKGMFYGESREDRMKRLSIQMNLSHGKGKRKKKAKSKNKKQYHRNK